MSAFFCEREARRGGIDTNTAAPFSLLKGVDCLKVDYVVFLKGDDDHLNSAATFLMGFGARPAALSATTSAASLPDSTAPSIDPRNFCDV